MNVKLISIVVREPWWKRRLTKLGVKFDYYCIELRFTIQLSEEPERLACEF